MQVVQFGFQRDMQDFSSNAERKEVKASHEERLVQRDDEVVVMRTDGK